MVTPLGLSTEATWAQACAGVSGIQAIPEHFGLTGYPVNAIGLVEGEQPLLDAVLSPKYHQRTERFIHLALIAGQQALAQAGITRDFPSNRQRIGCYVGIGVGGVEGTIEAEKSLREAGPKRVSPFVIPKIITNMAPGWLAMQFNLQGPSLALTTACASSTDALGMAFRAVRDGYVDYMLAGGSEACALPLTIAGFGNMRALSSWHGDPAQASRPFDKDRSGFVLAEGGAMLMLERLETAQERGATMIAEVVGYGATTDAYHLTAMHPEALGAIGAMQTALADAQLAPEDIDYINAHGTSTPMGDPQETLALKRVFGDWIMPTGISHAVVSSTKSMTGHMLGATGAAEAAFCALALRDSLVPPTINLMNPDPACDLDYVSHAARRKELRYAMTNSFGFGGSNAVLILRKS